MFDSVGVNNSNKGSALLGQLTFSSLLPCAIGHPGHCGGIAFTNEDTAYRLVTAHRKYKEPDSISVSVIEHYSAHLLAKYKEPQIPQMLLSNSTSEIMY